MTNSTPEPKPSIWRRQYHLPVPQVLRRTLRFCFSWKTIRFVMACVLTLVLGFYAIENFRGKTKWRKVLAEHQEKNDLLTIEAIVPPPAEDEENFGALPVFQELFSRPPKPMLFGEQELDSNFLNNFLPNHDLVHIGSGNHMRGEPFSWQKFRQYLSRQSNAPQKIFIREFTSLDSETAMAAKFLGLMDKASQNMEVFRSAMDLPRNRFPIDYNTATIFSTPLPHLSIIRAAVRIEARRAIALLELNRNEEAVKAFLTTVRLGESLNEEPFTISQLVRYTTFNISLQPFWEGWSQDQWNVEQLRKIQSALEPVDFFPGFRDALKMERAAGVALMDQLRKERKQIMAMGLMEESTEWIRNLGATLIRVLIPSGWFNQNKATIVQIHDRYLLASVDANERRLKPEIIQEFRDFVDRDLSRMRPYYFAARLLIPALDRFSQRMVVCQTQVDLAETVCGLEIYKKEKGEYPEHLADLTPHYLNEVPRDVISGKPLIYKKQGDTFRLYSVGWNMKDDGGTMGLVKNSKIPRNDWEQGDWVWPSRSSFE